MTSELERLQAALAGRYRLERELGRGGMATVYAAQDLKHDRAVAIKVLGTELAAVLGPERFLREIKLTAQLNHPHILPLLDSGDADGLLYYVMPYAEGESLRDRLNQEKQLPIEDALRIAREVADALDFAHAHNLVHRDIKPENILLEARHAIVADFGIARAISAVGGEKLTATGVAIGTPEYMSPEQAAGGRDLDGRSDIYALGCVLYEMLAGQPPFVGPTAESVLHQHLTSETPDVTGMRRAVSRECVAALRRALEKVPADRFVTGAAFAEALQAGIHSPRRAGRLAWRRAAIALGMAGMALVAGIGLWRRPWAAARGRAAPPRVVVLPFENLGRPEDEFFADGMTEEITSRLAQLPGLGVIGRTSAMQYKGGGKPLRTIGAELQADYVLEGSVRWSRGDVESRVRITPQLIRVADETHIWAAQYDAVLADVFAVQGQIAGQVVSALGVALGPSSEFAQAPAPTQNLEAYEQYLRGNALYGQCATAPCARAQEAMQHYQVAVHLDTSFAEAWARLTLAWAWARRPGEAPPTQVRDATARAMALGAHLAEAHLALGTLYYSTPEEDLPRAEAAFRRALELQPSHLEALRWLGLVLRRRGNMGAAADVLTRHADQDPRDERAQYDAGVTQLRLRRYDEAERYLQRYVAVAPNAAVGYRRLALLHLMRGGDTVAARRVVTAPLLTTPVTLDVAALWGGYNGADGFLELDRLLCDPPCARAARDWLAGAREPLGAADPTDWAPYLARGLVARLAGDRRLAYIYLDSALRLTESYLETHSSAVVHAETAAILAWLGRKEAAVRQARELVRSDPLTRDATNGPAQINTAAEILALFGEDEDALNQLDLVLSVPSYNSAAMVRVNPVWRQLRGNPRLQALLAKYDARHNN